MVARITLQQSASGTGGYSGWTYDFSKGGIVAAPRNPGGDRGADWWPDATSLRRETVSFHERVDYGVKRVNPAPTDHTEYTIAFAGEIALRRVVSDQRFEDGQYYTRYSEVMDLRATKLTSISHLDRDFLYGSDHGIFDIRFSAPVLLADVAGRTLGQILRDGDTIHGTASADTLKFTGRSEKIFGGDGNDVLAGRAGNDVIAGEMGADRLHGGKGADIFLFRSVAESDTRQSDLIRDFSRAEGDRINLKAIDAKQGTAANDKFRFIGTKAFSGSEGELRYQVTSKGTTYVYGDVDGDGKADLRIVLKGEIDLVKTDFLL